MKHYLNGKVLRADYRELDTCQHTQSVGTFKLENIIFMKRYLNEGILFNCFSPPLKHYMQWLKYSKHSFNIVLTKIHPASFLKSLMPHFMPQNCHPYQFL